MLTSQMRASFIDEEFSGEELFALTKLIADACKLAQGLEPKIAVSAECFGFERRLGEPLRLKLTESKDFETSLTQPDLLTIKIQGSYACDASLAAKLVALVELLATLHDEILLVEFHLQLILPRPADHRKLALHGQVHSGRFVMNTIWMEGQGMFDEKLWEWTAWPKESQLLSLLHGYLEHNRGMDSTFAHELFPGRRLKAYMRFMVWFIRYESLASWIGRLVISLCGCIASILGVMFLLHQNAFLLLVGPLATASLWSAVSFGWLLYQRVYLFAQYYQKMRRANSILFNRKLEYDPFDLSQNPALDQDIGLRKLTRDLLDAGASYVGDWTSGNMPSTQGTFVRVFHMPDGTAVMILFLYESGNNKIRPIRTTVLIRTELENGMRNVTLNGKGGYRQPRQELGVIARVFRTGTHPLDLLRKHRHVVALTLARLGTRVRYLSPHQILETEIENHDRTSQVIRRIGYFGIGDAIRMSFDSPLACYLADEID